MKRRRSMRLFDLRSRLAAVGGAAVGALLLSAPAEAAVKQVWAASFHAAESGPCVSKEYLGVEDGNPGATCKFFTQVQLPVGSMVQKIQYLYRSNEVVETHVYLETGFFPGTMGMAEWISASDNANTGGAVKTVGSSTFEFGNRKLKIGEMVRILAVISAPSVSDFGPVVQFLGVKIYYQ